MSKRPAIDLSSLTSEAATPMAEASQRMAPVAMAPPPAAAPSPPPQSKRSVAEEAKTANLEGLTFKVPGSFRRRFKQRALQADLKLNELLFAALEAWEEKHDLKG
jgi:hypothetical protein